VYTGETLMQVLIAHRESPIPSLREGRLGVPEGLDAIFCKMVAKKAEDRQQSMAEVIADFRTVEGELSSVANDSAANGEKLRARQHSIIESCGAVRDATQTLLTEAGTPHASALARKVPESGTQTNVRSECDTTSTRLGRSLEKPSRIRRKLLWLAGILGGLVLVAVGCVLTFVMRQGTLVVEIDEQIGKDVKVTVSHGGEQVKIADEKNGWKLSLSSGTYGLAVQGGDDRFQLDPQSVTVTHGSQVKVKVALKSPQPGPSWPLDSPVGKPGAPLPAIAPFDTAEAKKHQEAWAKHLGMPIEITNSIGTKFR
jgi:eukaryotic-like serine/threonine-protein kinase